MPALITQGRGESLSVLVAFLGFAAALALGLWSAADRLAAGWEAALRNRATVALPAGADPVPVLAALRQAPGVDAARALKSAEVAALVEPWLGGAQGTDGLPLPTLIAVDLAPGTDGQALASALPPAARTDTHAAWLSGALAEARRARTLAAALLLATLGAAALAITGATRARLAVHRAEVDLLHALGATRGQVTGQFAWRAAGACFVAGALGVAAGAGVLAMAQIGSPLPLALPPLLAVLGGGLAYAMVWTHLRRMP
ncbi:MAG TPA: hypothetical protein DDX54_06515 [Rhodospirillaceae bacterium]|jgi:cell division transport system permease protein|nr:hypothetical protein [Alphaproteobacteria bacterium]HBH27036.1 hypothetical protein [Rhodospirillaceae bacterium]